MHKCVNKQILKVQDAPEKKSDIHSVQLLKIHVDLRLLLSHSSRASPATSAFDINIYY